MRRRDLALACGLGIGLFAIGAVAAAGRDRAAVPARVSNHLSVSEKTSVRFSAVVHPGGRATTAFFEFGLGTRYREPRPAGIVYDRSTPVIHLKAAFHVYSISGSASGLLPNALYNLRLVASSSAGTVFSPNSTFRTAKDPPPPAPRFGVTVNVAPASGLVFFRPSPTRRPAAVGASLVSGPHYEPLTELRQLPIGSHTDARGGSLKLIVAGPRPRATQRLTLSGGVFALAQTRLGPTLGLTTVSLGDRAFPGAPPTASCTSPAPGSANTTVLQTLRARDQAGAFATSGRYSSATVTAAGTVWDTIDRCDGTLTIVHHGTVSVTPVGLGAPRVLHAGDRYLAQPPYSASVTAAAPPSRRNARRRITVSETTSHVSPAPTSATWTHVSALARAWPNQ